MDSGILGQERVQQRRSRPREADDEDGALDAFGRDLGKARAIQRQLQPPCEQALELRPHRLHLPGAVGAALVDPADQLLQARAQARIGAVIGAGLALGERNELLDRQERFCCCCHCPPSTPVSASIR